MFESDGCMLDDMVYWAIVGVAEKVRTMYWFRLVVFVVYKSAYCGKGHCLFIVGILGGTVC